MLISSMEYIPWPTLDFWGLIFMMKIFLLYFLWTLPDKWRTSRQMKKQQQKKPNLLNNSNFAEKNAQIFYSLPLYNITTNM